MNGNGPAFWAVDNQDTYLKLRPVTATQSDASGGSSATGVIVAAVIAVVVVVVGTILILRRRRLRTVEE